MSVSRKLIVLPALGEKWDQRAATELTGMLQRMKDILNGGVAESVHTMSKYVEYSFSAPTTASVSVQSPYPYKPASVELLEFWQTSGTQTPVSISGSLQWEWADGQILLPQLNGLTGNETYRIVLLVRGG